MITFPKMIPLAAPKPTRKASAQFYVGTSPKHKAPLFHMDWRSLERDKYAPWGRGSNSGLEN